MTSGRDIAWDAPQPPLANRKVVGFPPARIMPELDLSSAESPACYLDRDSCWPFLTSIHLLELFLRAQKACSLLRKVAAQVHCYLTIRTWVVVHCYF